MNSCIVIRRSWLSEQWWVVGAMVGSGSASAGSTIRLRSVPITAKHWYPISSSSSRPHWASGTTVCSTALSLSAW